MMSSRLMPVHSSSMVEIITCHLIKKIHGSFSLSSQNGGTIYIVPCLTTSLYAVENTGTESYVTEKLFYALDSGAIPIYFGAPNVWDFVPPHSVIDGTKFSSMEELTLYRLD
ncbi:hypothetical protein ACOSQ4_031695 [Xanthoceras sorbifolium]